MKELTINRSNK